MLLLLCVLCGCQEEDRTAEALLAEGQVLFKAGDYSGMMARFQRILDEYPRSRAADLVRQDWGFYQDLLRVEAQRLPTIAAQDLRRLGQSLEEHRSRQGRYPDRLEQLVPHWTEAIPADPWGRPYAYRRQRPGYVLETLGRDGEKGGDGEDADIRVVDGRLRNAPPLPPGG
jgi:hypothetical protein